VGILRDLAILRELCGMKKPRLDGVGGIPEDTAGSPGSDDMSAEISDLKHRLESIKADALRFVQDMTECGAGTPRAFGVWSGTGEDDRARSEEIRHRLRVFTLDLALAMERSPVLTKKDLRDIGLTGKRMCAALKFEQYTGSIIDRGEPIRVSEAAYLVKSGFEAMTQWVDLAPDPLPGASALQADAS
jgi:hypothetical protein